VISLLAAAHLLLFSWPGQPPKVLFELPMEGESACGIGTVTFGPADGSWSSGTAGTGTSCEFRQWVEPDSLLPIWADAGKIAPGTPLEIAWTLAGGKATGQGHKMTLTPEPVSPDAVKAAPAGLSAKASKVKNSVRAEVKNGGSGPVLLGDAVAARNRPADPCQGNGPQVLLQPGETLVDVRPGLLSPSMQVWVAAFTGPKSCKWVGVKRR
jgi:hypothetical protein